MFLHLDISQYQASLRLKNIEGKRMIWDGIRKKWLVLQPEEMVRQLLVHFLVQEAGYPASRMAIERALTVNTLQKRTDLLIYDPKMQPWLLVECKAPQVVLSEAVFRQIASYNLPLQVPYLLVCNGPQAYCCEIRAEDSSFAFLGALPPYPGTNY